MMAFRESPSKDVAGFSHVLSLFQIPEKTINQTNKKETTNQPTKNK